MNKQYANEMLVKAVREFADAYSRLLVTVDTYETETNCSVNDLPGFTEAYPFDKSLDELAINQWADEVANRNKPASYKVLNYQYVNTGGNTMVGVFEVWLPERKQVVYALTNEEGCTLSVVDYIRNELDVDNYDDFHIDVCDWGRLTGYEDYFELYRHCLNVYTKDDCRFFGTSRDIQLHLLSDELKAKISDDYRQWLYNEGRDSVMTDGKDIIVDPDYEATNSDEVQLEAVKEFKRWHDAIAGDEKYYSECYKLVIADREVTLPFYADVWNAVDDALKSIIDNW